MLCCTMLCYAVLYYTILCYTILYYTILCYTVLYCTVPHCSALFCTVPRPYPYLSPYPYPCGMQLSQCIFVAVASVLYAVVFFTLDLKVTCPR